MDCSASNATSVRKRTRSAIADLPIDAVVACVLPFCDNGSLAALIRTGTCGVWLVVLHIMARQGARAQWRIRYEIHLRARYRLGFDWAVRMQAFNRQCMPRVMSRACRGCGRYTERKVMCRVPLCEKCTKNKKMRWCMVRACHFDDVMLLGLYVHRGRRADLVFVDDIARAMRISRDWIFEIANG